MADDKRVDPRYDPAFQRGFDGPVTSALRSRPVQQSGVVTPAPYRAATAPVSASPTADRSGTAPTAAEQTAIEPADRDESRRATVVELHDEPAPARRLSRNPFLIALTLLGAAMTVGGIAWANQARMLVATRGGAATDLDYWFLQASVAGAPLTIIAGIGILAGVLFIAAIAWNRR